MIHSIELGDIFGVVERRRTVPVGYEKDVLRWEDLDSRFKGCTNDASSFVARDEQGSLMNRLISARRSFNGRGSGSKRSNKGANPYLKTNNSNTSIFFDYSSDLQGSHTKHDCVTASNNHLLLNHKGEPPNSSTP